MNRYDDPDPNISEDSPEFTSEIEYICNSCGESIVIPLDISQGRSQEYVEDCPVCCHPNLIYIEFDETGRASIRSESE